MPVLRAQPLTARDYEPYGHIVAPGDDHAARSANQGYAKVWDRLAPMVNTRSHASLNVSVFRCGPPTLPIALRCLEKHPFSTQLFVPMARVPYLAVVALGGDLPDLSTLSAFFVPEGTAISYSPGIWHHPMLPAGREIDFVCFVHEDGSRDDCVMTALDAGWFVDFT